MKIIDITPLLAINFVVFKLPIKVYTPNKQ